MDLLGLSRETTATSARSRRHLGRLLDPPRLSSGRTDRDPWQLCPYSEGDLIPNAGAHRGSLELLGPAADAVESRTASRVSGIAGARRDVLYDRLFARQASNARLVDAAMGLRAS